MKLLWIIAGVQLILALSACGTKNPPAEDGEQLESRIFDYKAPPKSEPKLEVPPELTPYSFDDRFSIPGEGESGTRFSEYQQGMSGRKLSGILPPVRNVRMERNGNQRWLVVNDKAENIWSVVKSFWEENGLTLKVENPQAGIMETDWMENRAKLPNDFFREYFGKAFEGLLSSGEKDQFHTRLERTKDGAGTEIYIAHYGLMEVETKDQTGFKWISRPTDPELEATMLQLLTNKLGGGSGVLDKKQKKKSGDDKSGAAGIKLKSLPDGSSTIVLSETFDKSWRRAGLAIEQAGIILADKDRSKGIFYLSAGKTDIVSRAENEKPVRNQIILKEISSGCELSVVNGAGVSTDETRKITETLYKALGRL